MSIIKDSYENGECPDCGEDIPDDVSNGDECSNCSHVFYSPVKPEDETFESIKLSLFPTVTIKFGTLQVETLIEDTLFILQVDDMIGFYDNTNGEGSYDKLSATHKTELQRSVKKHLEYGLGEAWADYMRESIRLAQEDWSIA